MKAELRTYYCLLTLDESETAASEEMQCKNISNAVSNAYQLFTERSEVRVLELWGSHLILKLERSRT
jgi:hypothetical protein